MHTLKSDREGEMKWGDKKGEENMRRERKRKKEDEVRMRGEEKEEE